MVRLYIQGKYRHKEQVIIISSDSLVSYHYYFSYRINNSNLLSKCTGQLSLSCLLSTSSLKVHVARDKELRRTWQLTCVVHLSSTCFNHSWAGWGHELFIMVDNHSCHPSPSNSQREPTNCMSNVLSGCNTTTHTDHNQPWISLKCCIIIIYKIVADH